MSKAAPFAYVRASALEDACSVLAAHGSEASILAGGQSLMPALNLRLARPQVLVDINRLAELAGIERRKDIVRIGALARHCDVLASPIVARHLPLLARAMPHVAHPAIRRRGTFGGSLCHADPTAEIPACVLAQGGRIVLASAHGRRTIAAEDFLVGVMETARAPDEVLVEIELPASPADEAVAFREIARRRGDFAIVGVAGRARRQGARLHDLRLVVFGCERRPHLARSAAQAIEGKRCDEGAARAIASAVAAELDPMEDANGPPEIKRRQAEVLLRRVLIDLSAGGAA